MIGQFDIFGNEEGIKPLHYYMSLTWFHTRCPYCGTDNPENGIAGNICKYCNKKFDAENMILHKSKDYIECEKLGLHGAVRKNIKNEWEEVPVVTNIKNYN